MLVVPVDVLSVVLFVPVVVPVVVFVVVPVVVPSTVPVELVAALLVVVPPVPPIGGGTIGTTGGGGTAGTTGGGGTTVASMAVVTLVPQSVAVSVVSPLSLAPRHRYATDNQRPTSSGQCVLGGSTSWSSHQQRWGVQLPVVVLVAPPPMAKVSNGYK